MHFPPNLPPASYGQALPAPIPTLAHISNTSLRDALQRQWLNQAGHTTLDLRACHLNDADAAQLAELLASHPGLTELDLSDNQIGETGATRLAAVLERQHTHLTRLYLNDNQLGCDGVAAFGRFIASTPSLTELGLAGNRIGLPGVALLAPTLARHPGLVTLNLRRNGLNDAAAIVLAVVLEHCPNLRALELGN